VLTIQCHCGEVFHAEEQHVGRAIKCWRCGQLLSVGALPPQPADPVFVHGTPPKDGVAHGRQPKHRWGFALLALTTLVVTAALGVLFILRSDEKQKPITFPPPPPPVAQEGNLEGTKSLSKGNEQREAVTVAGAARNLSTPPPQPAPPAISRPVASQTPALAPPPLSTLTPPATRLRTGTNIWPPLGAPGRGTLRIHNGTGYDAAVTLRDTETLEDRRYVYLRARDVITVGDLAPCQCRLFFALGTDWDVDAEEFREDPSFAVFDDILRFAETETEQGIEWAEFSVTLHPVPDGKARTTQLSKQEFQRQLGKRQGRPGV